MRGLRTRRALSWATALAMAAGLAGASTAAAQADPAAIASPPHLVSDPTAYVDPFIGTGRGGNVVGEINNFPGAAAPFGMMQFSPDTVGSYAGYQYHSDAIRGFSLNHASVGCSAFGDVPVLPVVGDVGSDPGNRSEHFSHSDESASPGSYAVTLQDSQVHAELTAATRTGLAQFTFPATSKAQVLVKAGGSLAGDSAADVQVIGDHEVTGSATTGGFCGNHNTYTVYYDIVFDRPFTASGTWNGTSVTAPLPAGGAQVRADGRKIGAYLTFDATQQRTVRMKVAMSFVSPAGARANMAAEVPGWDLATVRDATRAQWRDALSKVRVGGGTDDQLKTFYTALYHSLLAPNTFNDVDGEYMGFDDKVHRLPAGHNQYANFSDWDTYRSLAPLQAMLFPRQAGDMAQSLVDDAEQGGWIPRWPLYNGYTGQMNGDNSVPLISSLYAFGARDFDVKSALAYMVKGATTSAPTPTGYVERPGVENYVRLGYDPNDETSRGDHGLQGASMTLEWAIDDFAISRLARAAGDGKTATAFARRGQNWQNIFNPVTGYLQPRDDSGAFPPGPAFVPPPPGAFGQDGYDEGNAAQYGWLVPQNMRGLITAIGGRTAAADRLDAFFTQTNVGPNEPYMWAGNEVDFGVPWTYDYLGRPWRTQQVVRQLETTLYGPTPDGEPGNDDLGAQSSWLVWSELGMYPVTPGTPDLALDSPLFPVESMTLPNGHHLDVRAPQATADHPYVRALTVDGHPWNRTSLPERTALDGGTLDFTLGATPDTHWATAENAAPPSYPQGEAPAIGYATAQQPGTAVTSSGADLTVGAENTSDHAERVRWQAAPQPGLTVSPASGSLTVRPGAKATAPVHVAVADGNPGGFEQVGFTFHTGDRDLTPADVPLTVPTPGADSATACDTLGATDTEHGVRRVEQAGDGATAPVTVAAVPARTMVQGQSGGGRYMYFAVDHRLTGTGTYQAKVAVTFFDHGTDTWTLQYDSAWNGSYENAPPVTKTGTDTWRTVVLTLPDARFDGGENGGSDFRVSADGSTDAQAETIAKIGVELTGPSVPAIHLCPTA